jgi:hypothetical protein
MKDIKNPTILLHGISRSGKAVTWYLVGSIHGIDAPQNNPFSDWIIDAYKAKKIEADGLSTLLYEFYRLNAWFSFIGRNLNLKDIDHSAFLKFSTDEDLRERSLLPDNNDSWVEFASKWKDAKFIPCFTSGLDKDIQTLFANQDISFININTLRSPKRVFLEWCQTERCSRFDKLDKMGVYYFQYNGLNIPGYAFDFKDEWVESTPEERCFMVVENYYEGFFKENKENSSDINIIFEDMVQNPLPSIEKISTFFDLKIKDDYMNRLSLMNVPRVLDFENYHSDPSGYFKKIQSSSYERLNELENQFRNFKELNK